MSELCLTNPLQKQYDVALNIIRSDRQTWQRKPILRAVYRDFYTRIANQLSDISGPTIEFGSGPGTLKSALPNVIISDVVAAPWLDLVADATALPLAEASVANVVAIDLLHHLAYPRRFFNQVARVLKPCGRLVILDAFLSALSWPVYRFLHPEPASLSIRPLDQPQNEPLFNDRDPWSSDQGITRAIFWKQMEKFIKLFPELSIKHRECFSLLVWPMSGGFRQKNRLPRFAEPFLWKMEHALDRFGRYAGYRSLVTLEKQECYSASECNDDNLRFGSNNQRTQLLRHSRIRDRRELLGTLDLQRKETSPSEDFTHGESVRSARSDTRSGSWMRHWIIADRKT